MGGWRSSVGGADPLAVLCGPLIVLPPHATTHKGSLLCGQSAETYFPEVSNQHLRHTIWYSSIGNGPDHVFSTGDALFVTAVHSNTVFSNPVPLFTLIPIKPYSR